MKCPTPELSATWGSSVGVVDVRWRGRCESSRSRSRWTGLKFGMRIQVGCGTVVCGAVANGDSPWRDVVTSFGIAAKLPSRNLQVERRATLIRCIAEAADGPRSRAFGDLG